MCKGKVPKHIILLKVLKPHLILVKRLSAKLIGIVAMITCSSILVGIICFLETRQSVKIPYYSGQHLISALFERDYNFDTISWSLSQEVSYIELSPNAVVTQDHIDTVERVCNELIAAATPVFAQILGAESPEEVSEVVIAVLFKDF